jgi:hypothetical protein
MRPAYGKALCLAGLLIWVGSAAYGQSLGDVAREQRQKQQAKDTKSAAKVITNEDLPEHPDSSASAPGSEGNPEESSSRHLGSKSPEQWKSEIAAQSKSVEDLQSQIDKVNSSVHFVEANRYWNGVQYNERQIQKQEAVQRMQAQLDEQKKKLGDMQEAARKAGYGNAVYEP